MMARMSWLAAVVSVPHVTAKRETVDPRAMRTMEASIEGQLRSTVPLMGRTASIRVEGV